MSRAASACGAPAPPGPPGGRLEAAWSAIRRDRRDVAQPAQQLEVRRRDLTAVQALVGDQQSVEAPRAAQRRDQRDAAGDERRQGGSQLGQMLELAVRHRTPQAGDQRHQLAIARKLEPGDALEPVAPDRRRLERPTTGAGQQQGRHAQSQARLDRPQEAARQVLHIRAAMELAPEPEGEVAEALGAPGVIVRAPELRAHP